MVGWRGAVRSWPGVCDMSSGSVQRRCAGLTGRSPKHVKVAAEKLLMTYGHRARMHGVLQVAGTAGSSAPDRKSVV